MVKANKLNAKFPKLNFIIVGINRKEEESGK